ncbi:MAG: biosynthetic-type acetolactate synthase large subunit [Chloroflexota bacterium]
MSTPPASSLAASLTTSVTAVLERPSMPATGGSLLCEALKAHGVTVMFGYPGGAALPLYRELANHPQLEHLLVRHEENAALAADGYARATGRPGVCLATSGPGATNLLTGIANAMMDSVPVLALTGQVASSAIGTQAFQEVDIISMARPVTKATFQARTPDEVPGLVAEAFRVMMEGRPGPVLLDLPKDVMLGLSGGDSPEPAAGTESPRRLVVEPEESDVRRVLELLANAERPVLAAGRGVLLANATDHLLTLAERSDTPVVTTLLGLGSVDESHELAFGMAGMHGTVAANMALHHADLVIGVGMRFDDRWVGRAADFAPGATIVHVDVDREAFGRVVRCDVPVLADAGSFLAALAERAPRARRQGWLESLRAWEREHVDCLRSSEGDALGSADAVRMLREETGGAVTLVADVGQHQMYAALHWGFERPDSFFTSGGLGTMGYSLPAAMGIKMARPAEEVWTVVGDGCFQMSTPELTTLAANRIDVKMLLLNNSCLGMVRQWQELFYDGVYSHSILPQPDFARLAESHGVAGRTAASHDELREAIRWARETPGPVLIDVRVPMEETVLPMVPAGAANGEILCAEGRVLVE